MPPIDTHELSMFILRWAHLIAGITWIGLLYFFNFVMGPFEKTLDGDSKKKVVPELRPRALWWFRWGAMVTMLAGVGMIGMLYQDKMSDLVHTERGQWITFGAGLGLIMWFNVWFIIWPAQKQIIGWIKKGEKPPEMDATIKRAFMASRFNTYVSVPMLFGMGAGSGHLASCPCNWITLPVVLVVGLAISHHLIGLGPKVGKFE